MLREVPSGWIESQIDAVADINPDSLRSNTTADFGIKYIDVATVDGPSTMLEPRSMSFGDAPSRARKKVQRGDILISTVRPYLRSFCQVLSNEPNLVASTAFAVLRPKPQVDGDFLYQHVLGERFIEHLTPRMKGSNYPAVTAGDVGAYPFLLPPLHEQRRIAEILSSVDEAIAATRAVIEQTRKVKQGVLERLLTKGIGHTRFKRTEIGEIPEGWHLKRLEEIADIDRGKFSVRPRNDPRYFGGDIPFVQTGDVASANGRLLKHSQTLNELGRGVSKEFPSGAILITIAANIGDTAITSYPVCCPDSVVGIVPSDGVNTNWLREFLVLQKPSLDRQATQNAQKNINLQHLRPMQIAVPPVDEQRDIGRRIQAMNDGISENGLELANMESLKSALMSDLLTGRKRVTDALPVAAE